MRGMATHTMNDWLDDLRGAGGEHRRVWSGGVRVEWETCRSMVDDTMTCPRCSTPVPRASRTGTDFTEPNGGRFRLELCPNCLAILERPRDLEAEQWAVLQEPTANTPECIAYAETRLGTARTALDEGRGEDEDVASIEAGIARLERELQVVRARANALGAA
jgi:hypothetical protein